MGCGGAKARCVVLCAVSSTGGRVWHEEALPHQERGGRGGMLVVLPPEATAADNALLREANERDVPCVPPEYIIERLTQRDPRGTDAFRIMADPKTGS